jgi:hypothetical protein
LENLFNQKSAEYRRLNLQHIKGSSLREEILLKNPKLYKTSEEDQVNGEVIPRSEVHFEKSKNNCHEDSLL